jgi:hypothetical protein
MNDNDDIIEIIIDNIDQSFKKLDCCLESSVTRVQQDEFNKILKTIDNKINILFCEGNFKLMYDADVLKKTITKINKLSNQNKMSVDNKKLIRLIRNKINFIIYESKSNENASYWIILLTLILICQFSIGLLLLAILIINYNEY